MIQNILRLIKYAPIALLLLSCEDYLELRPENTLTQDDFWQTEDHVSSALAGCYYSMTQTDFTNRLFKWGELRAEMLIPNLASGNDQNMMDNYILPSNANVNWAVFYKTINYCNLVLEFTDQAQEADLSFTEEQANIFKAEATAIRSFVYFNLVKNFREVPLVLTATSTTQIDFHPAKNTEEEIMTKIIADLEDVVDDLRPGYDDSGVATLNEYDRGRITQGGAYAMLADMYLWTDQFDKCITACNNIDALASERPVAYKLEDGADWFRKIFFEGNASYESIFEIQYNTPQDNVTFYDAFYEGFPDFKPYPEIVDLYHEDGQLDIRGRLGSFTTIDNSEFVWKYIGVDNTGLTRTQNEYFNNYIVYRYADVLLMKAEAYILSTTQQNFQEAHNLINQVHFRATNEDLVEVLNENSLINSLVLERQKEFAFEGKRWHDLLRFAKRNNFERQSLITDLVDIKAGDDEYQQILSYYSEPESYYLPIYANEVAINKNLEQNPYYVNN